MKITIDIGQVATWIVGFVLGVGLYQGVKALFIYNRKNR